MVSEAHTNPGAERTPTAGRPQKIKHLGEIDACPRCAGRDFLLREAGEHVVFHCLGCDRGWRYELGFVWPAGTRTRLEAQRE